MDGPCVFGAGCKLEGVKSYDARPRYYPCNQHFYHPKCSVGTKSVCPVCDCAECAQKLGRADVRVIETCKCRIHTGCVPWNATQKECPRCHAPITAITDPNAVVATAVARSVAWNPFGKSTSEKVHDIGSRLGIQGLLDNKITFRQFEATRATLDLLATWGATAVHLKNMGFTRSDLLNPRYFQPEVLVKLGFSWLAFQTMYDVTWRDVKHLGLTVEQLRLLRASLFSLCEKGFDFDDLTTVPARNVGPPAKAPVAATVPVEEWAGDPFNLAEHRFLLLPTSTMGFALTPERVAKLRLLAPGNWTDEQIECLWPRGTMTNAERRLLGIPYQAVPATDL